MEPITPPSAEANLRADEEEDANASKILEIINGGTVATSKMTEDAEDREVWLMEMGDDSVFYSDEDQACQGTGSGILTGFSAKRWRDPANSVADGETHQQMESNPGEKGLFYKGNSGMEKEMNQFWTKEENQQLETFKTKRMHVSDPSGSATDSDVTPGKFVKTSREFALQNKTANVDRQVQKEEATTQADTSNQHLFHLLNSDGYTGLNVDAGSPQRISGAYTQKSSELGGDMRAESPQNPGQGQISDCSAFNHLASSKYSTVSYRRICRGNTRQRIKEFEFLLTNKK